MTGKKESKTSTHKLTNSLIMADGAEVIELNTPLGVDGEITQLVVKRPTIRILDGLSLTDIFRMEVYALSEIFPKVCAGLTKQHFNQMELYDVTQFGRVLTGFLGTPRSK